MCEATDNAGSKTAGLTQPGRKVKIVIGLLIVLCSLFLSAAGKQNLDVGAIDETAYLSLACEIADETTFWGFPAYYLSGEFDDRYRGPIYLWLLSTFCHRDYEVAGSVRVLNVVIGAAGALLCYVLVSLLAGWTVGAIAGFLVAFSTDVTVYNGIAAAEPLVILICLPTWYFYLRGFEGRHRYWIWALALTGVCYYTKAQAAFLVPAFLLAGVISYKWQFFRMRSLWIGLAAFFIVMLPAFIRNVNAFGTPLYSIPSQELWLDKLDQHHEPGWEQKYGLVQYFQTHSIAEFVERTGDGFSQQIGVISAGILAPSRISGVVGIVSTIIGAVAFLAFLLGLAADSDRKRFTFHLILLAMFVAVFSQRTGIGCYARFYYPIIGMFVLYAGSGFVLGYQALNGALPRTSMRWLAFFCIFVLAFYGLLTARKGVTEAGLAVWRVPSLENTATEHAMRYIESNLPEGQTVYMAPSAVMGSVEWLLDGKYAVKWVPYLQDWEAARGELLETPGGYLLVDEATMQRRDAVLGGFIDVAADGSLELAVDNVPDILKPVWQYGEPAEVIILQIVPPEGD